MALAVRGDEQVYKVVLSQDAGRGGVSYQSDFVAGCEWAVVQLPFASFRPSWRGRPVPGAAPLQPASIVRMGLRLSLKLDSGAPNPTLRDGPFQLDVRWIRPY